MKKTITVAGLGALFALATAPAQAAVITLFDYAFNIDGGLTEDSQGDPLPANVAAGGFDFATGLGRIDVTITGAGAHSVTAFFDHEIDEAINTFFNETGTASGVPAVGQSWEIDEPGFLFGDIYDNLLGDTLDGLIGFEGPEDVSMAMGFDFLLAGTQTAVVSFFTSVLNPGSGFFLRQSDAASVAPNELFFWGALDIRGVVIEPPPPPTDVPEPTTLALLAAGLLSLGLRRRRA